MSTAEVYWCYWECDTDCEIGPVHCYWQHQPNHKGGWHLPADCPVLALIPGGQEIVAFDRLTRPHQSRPLHWSQ